MIYYFLAFLSVLVPHPIKVIVLSWELLEENLWSAFARKSKIIVIIVLLVLKSYASILSKETIADRSLGLSSAFLV